jgi:hypothetical protein
VTIRLYRDETIALNLDEIVRNLNRLAPRWSFVLGKARFSVTDEVIAVPDTYQALDHRISDESADDEEVILFTEKPYDNNYFWEPDGNKAIVSLFAWDHLTTLPRNNGAVYFICALLVRILGVGHGHGEKNTGCVNDFWRDKTGVDAGMRSGHVCERCVRDLESQRTKTVGPLLKDVQAILDDLSTASRSSTDVCELWKEQTRADAFDVFMCHNSDDKPSVREMNQRLRASRIKTWLDEEQLPPGRVWQDLLEQQIQSVRTAAIFVGSSGIGPWQNVEARAFIQEFVRRQCPVIPVILNDCQNVPTLPLFLSQLTWVDFRKDSPDPFDRLLWGITGVKPSK